MSFGTIARMKRKPTTLREWIAYILVVVLIQPSMMYLCLRVLHWNFFLSAFLVAALAVGIAMLAVTIVSRRAGRSTEQKSLR